MKPLTVDQRDWIIAEYWKLMDKSAVVSRRQLVDGLREILSANTEKEVINAVGRPRVSVSVDRAKLKELREGKGLSQQDIAQALGYTDARITQFETGSGTGG